MVKTTEQMILEALEQLRILKDAHSKLNELWMADHNNVMDDLLVDAYPYHKCFNELTHEVDDWLESVLAKIEELKMGRGVI